MTAPAIGSGQEKYVKADFRRQDWPIYAFASAAVRSDCLSRIEGNGREMTAMGPLSAAKQASVDSGRYVLGAKVLDERVMLYFSR